MNFFKEISDALKRIIKLRTIIIFFSVLAVVFGTSISMADWTGDSTEVYTMGNVGIGTTTLTRKLNIDVGTAAPGIRLLYTNGGASSIEFAEDGVPKAFMEWDDSDDKMHFYLGGGAVENRIVTITSNGFFNIKGALRLFGSGTNGDWEITPGLGDSNFGIVHKPTENPVFSIATNGDVGIGKKYPEYKLDVAGTTKSNFYECDSDVRYKKNVLPFNNALEKVLGLRGVSYFWKADEYKEHNFSKEKQIGFIAQEVEKIIPELVSTDSKGYKTMSYDRLTAVIVEAIKEMKTEKDTEIAILKKENQELREEIASLKSMNQRIAALENALKLNQQIAAK